MPLEQGTMPEAALGSDPDSNRPRAESPLEATVRLLHLAKEGDRAALDRLMARCLPRLRVWASGRLPSHSRSLMETDDLVQEALIRTMQGLDRLELRGSEGFHAYLRTAILNRIRDEVRWSARRPGTNGVLDSLISPEPTPMELAIGADLASRYERALATLTPVEQELLLLRIEMDCDYTEIAEITGRPSREAARLAVTRAVRHLAEVLGDGR